MFSIRATGIPGCFEIQPRVLGDCRGRFVKIFHREAFAALGLETELVEEYFTESRRGVIRGLHFQTPPMDHIKVVFCVSGCVRDAVVDLRRGSPSFGCYELFELNAETANMVYIPKGLAHGFCTLSSSATLVYKTSTVYSPEHDAGVLWNSAGIPWSVTDPVLSDRDGSHPPLARYRSPFIYEQMAAEPMRMWAGDRPVSDVDRKGAS
jgi:dTDP-4-dehydrorhamnose 3,5-epimerase